MDDRTYDDLALALMYAMSWKEKYAPEGFVRTWIGFDFDALDRLEDRDLISGRHGNKSKWITPDGVERAKRILEVIERIEPELTSIPDPERRRDPVDEDN